MPEFDYQQVVWGAGSATQKITDPSANRLKFALESIAGLKCGAKVLEFGCGVGRFIKAIKSARPDLACVGVDISKKAIESAIEQNNGVDFVVSADGGVLPFQDHKFDAVLVFDVLEHVKNPSAAIGEIRRVLKDEGVFYCFVPCEGDWLSIWKYLSLISRLKNLTFKYAGHINKLSRGEWKNVFRSNGFLIKNAFYSEHFFGQIVGVLSFILVDIFTDKNKFTNNEQFFNDANHKFRENVLFRVFKNIINAVVFFESIILRKIPSPNTHFILKKS
jgi:ubiquinone/menaquinone biosynthesis C-methylase UbiE